MISKLLVFLVRIYQYTLSPFVGNCCRFYPSCSEYAIDALRKKGALKGTWLTIKRLVKCQPWHPGGVDFVPSEINALESPILGRDTEHPIQDN